MRKILMLAVLPFMITSCAATEQAKVDWCIANGNTSAGPLHDCVRSQIAEDRAPRWWQSDPNSTAAALAILGGGFNNASAAYATNAPRPPTICYPIGRGGYVTCQ
jgi:hypothetical protein